MAGDVEILDPELSDGASDVGESEREQEHEQQHEPDVVDPTDDDNSPMAEQKLRSEVDENGKAVGATAKPKYDPKDPLRPRRKKARRACFACQRAHLTCGMSVLLCIVQHFRASAYIFDADEESSLILCFRSCVYVRVVQKTDHVPS